MHSARLTNDQVRIEIQRIYDKHKNIYEKEHRGKFNEGTFGSFQLRVSAFNPTVSETIERVAPSIETKDILLFARIGGIFCSAVIFTRHAVFWKRAISVFNHSVKLRQIEKFSWCEQYGEGSGNYLELHLKDASLLERGSHDLGCSFPDHSIDFLNEVLVFLQNNP